MARVYHPTCVVKEKRVKQIEKFVTTDGKNLYAVISESRDRYNLVSATTSLTKWRMKKIYHRLVDGVMKPTNRFRVVIGKEFTEMYAKAPERFRKYMQIAETGQSN